MMMEAAGDNEKPKTPPAGVVSPPVPRPPVDPNRPIRRTGSRGRLLHSLSVESSSEEISLKTRSGSLQDVSSSGKEEVAPDVLTRRVHSGPKERVGQLLEERGVGDGSESVHRPPSAVTTTSVSSQIGSDNELRVKSGGSSRRPSSGGKPGSGGKREEETPAESQFFNKNIAPILEQMAALRKEKDATELSNLCSMLYCTLEQGNMLGRACKRRSAILKTIFKLLDSESPVLRVRLAKLILGLKITGNNLTSVCKLIFKISREESNDMLFIEEEMIAPLLDTMCTTDLSTSQDALVYLLGALKFLSGNTTVGQHLTKHRAVEAYGKLLKAINTATADSKEKMGNVLVQLTAGLRNLVDNEENRENMVSSHVIEEMERSTQLYSADSEVVHNIIRIFSKVTLHSDCCNALNSIPSTYKSFLYLLNQYIQKQDLIVRLTFVIGNLTAKSDDARLRFFQEENAFKTILNIFKTYLELDMKSFSKHKEEVKESGTGSKHPDTVEDIMIKVVRVIANLSINEEVGKQLATNEKCVEWLLHIIDTKDMSTSEELVLNSVATINNLSFYHVPGSAVVKKQQQVTES
ncbi:armadillo repeat-containing protein 2-like [Lingula anatina]|uniref:Armadillo repeat-containing protein 2-like n=1 Tax=Lingula anatina TaxID=7574 RepID=A0A1S3HKA6_LINAN|nr:armadillo repeat-containing protein 2-like [Lingula anatina]|eukprot:XP_013385891.1 armadillo repeat-containing protein 2-like [Lingula anatina]